MGDMIPGTEQTLFDVKGARLAVLICYESVFPDLTRREVKRGADVLVNITNDAWYGESSAPYQLLAMAAMRSVETKVPMVRGRQHRNQRGDLADRRDHRGDAALRPRHRNRDGRMARPRRHRLHAQSAICSRKYASC